MNSLKLSSLNKIVVLGVGNHFMTCKKILDGHVEYLAYSDNASHKWGKDLFNDGIVCIPPEKILDTNADAIVIGVSEGEVQKKLINQVTDMGVDYCLLDELIDLYVDEFESKERKRRERIVDDFFLGKEGNHRIFLLNTPEVSSTIGDHAISTAEVIFLEKRFEDRTVVEIGDRFFWEYREEIAKHIFPSDVLLIQGGGYMGSLWRMWREDTIRYILQKYPENHIVIMPHTLFFENTEDGRNQYSISREIYNSHRYLTVCLREKVSFERSAKLFDSHVRRYLVPDSVLSMRYTGKVDMRKGVAVFFKNDKETLISKEKQNSIRKYFEGKGVQLIDTTMFFSEQINGSKDREKIIRKKMDEISGFELFITDAMHGMILSAVCQTPCVGVETITGKVGAMYEWIHNLPYMEYDSDGDGVIKKADKLLSNVMVNKYDCPELDKNFEMLGNIIWEQLHFR